MMAAALARRGYENAMPVQAAVMDPALADRDLLVSSQTGSGKTIAFGLSFAPSLLDSQAPRSEKGYPQPRVLVVAPTRELATQVSNELGWLYADAPVRLASFTGGTHVGTDVRRLRMGVDVVVGTPGRLVDLLTRGALDLSAIAVLVLDEADEMMDMGFKEDLEALLGAAPDTRRTLFFSATIPPTIARLASTYQNKAARLDMRPAGGAKAHSDIEFVAHLVSMRDRFAAVVNELLVTQDAKTIIFCRTREDVGQLQHKLVAHGFSAVAMAGDRAQGERDRALAALRSGAARILVATNVAARGLDVPDVEMVIHGDLPDGIESLTHRSGRTGRAGRKGTSIILADPSKRRRAERLFNEAGIKVRWSSPVTKEQAERAAEDSYAQRLVALLGVQPEEGQDAVVLPEGKTLVDRLLALVPERALLDLLLKREMERVPAALPVEPILNDVPQKRVRGAFEGPRNDSFESRGRRIEAPRAEAPRGRGRAFERPVPDEVEGFVESFEDAPRRPAAAAARAVPSRAPAVKVEPVKIQALPAAPAPAPRSRSGAEPAKIERVRSHAQPLERNREQSFEPSFAPRHTERPAPRDTEARGGRSVIFRVNLGANEHAEPRILLPIICRRGDVDRSVVGGIRVGPQSSTFEIAAEAAVAFARAASKPDPIEPHIRIEAARPGESSAPSGGGGGGPRKGPPGRGAPAGLRPQGGRAPLGRKPRQGMRPYV
ncbi:MAG: DEAD/DEAH box helicase [Deltaproteobacteria bacterium]|nr:DEAD/DEAH box helicase [Deltaproteobacteria bacterium]